MQKKARFDDRIRNLIALAEDGTRESRTLLFSHISDLFLQKRPMASATQVRMLTDILKELLSQVELSTRREIATALCTLSDPPEELVNILSEDVVEVSGPLLEKAILPDDRLMHIIRFGSEAHRIHISRRFGLSPLVRQELERAYQESQSSKLKYSLNDLEKLAGDQTPDLDEATTANILHLLQAQNIHQPLPDPDPQTAAAPNDAPRGASLSAESEPEGETTSPGDDRDAALPAAEDAPPRPAGRDAADPLRKNADHAYPHSALHVHEPSPDKVRAFPSEIAANDAMLPESLIHMKDISAEMVQDIWRDTQTARDETWRQQQFVRAVADWFWEVDRTGALSFLSEEAFTVFGRPAQALLGEDFVALCRAPAADDVRVATEEDPESFEFLFEHRTSFRNKPFYISSQKGEATLWYISAIAIFDIHSGRFTGFRGSARADISAARAVPPPSPGIVDAQDAPAQSNPAATDEPQRPGTSRQSGTTGAAPATQPQARQNRPAPPQRNSTSQAATAQAAPMESAEDIATELLHNLSHEFRTPLNAIIGFSEMIDMETWGPVNPTYHQHTRNILAAAGQLKEAVNDVLDSARLDAGLVDISPESFSLKSVMKNCIGNAAPLAKEHDVTLCDSDNNIDVILFNDKQSVELCLTKMLSSSIKRATGGEIINPSVLINSDAQVRIEIPILGPAIEAENADHIFQRLTRRPDKQRKNAKNDFYYEPKIASGYGLSIAKDLAVMIGGDITTHVAKGKITHLVLTLSNHDTPA